MDRGEFFSKAFKLVVGKGLEIVTDNPIADLLERSAGERPPGALKDDRAFRATCTGCDQCMIACPHNVIMVEDPEDKRYPVIYPDAPCKNCPDTPCINACKTNALTLIKS